MSENKFLFNQCLGQNFLTDKNYLNKIGSTLDIFNKNVIEIGPGRGHLTEIILKNQPKSLVLIEKDRRLIPYLEDRFNLKIIHEDCLRIEWCADIIISNLPYNITHEFLMKLYENNIQEVYLMLQKEVVDRIIAKCGSNNYGFLSILMQTSFDIEVLITLPPTAFYPAPKVWSNFIKFTRRDVAFDKKKAIVLAKKLFMNKNKKLKNIIDIKGDIILGELRPNFLEIENFLKLI